MTRGCIILIFVQLMCCIYLSTQDVKMLCDYSFNNVSLSNSNATVENYNKTKIASCDKYKFLKGLSHMGVANPEDIGILPSSQRNADDFCNMVEAGLMRMIPAVVKCEIDDDVIYFRTLFTGLASLSSKLCDDQEFRKQYAEEGECLNKLYWEFEECDGSAQWICDSNQTLVCYTYRSIQTCIFLKAGILCGWRGARLMNAVVKTAFDHMLRIKCANSDCEPQVPEDITFAGLAAGWLSGSTRLIVVVIITYAFKAFCV